MTAFFRRIIVEQSYMIYFKLKIYRIYKVLHMHDIIYI